MTDDALDEDTGADPAGADAPEAPALPPGTGEAEDPALAALQQALAQCEDRFLRTAAEFDNYRKRTERERREQADRTVADVLLDVLGIVDDLERALEADAGRDGVAAYKSGVELIHRKVLDLLRRRDVRPIEAVGTPFDPNVHQAVSTEPAGDRADGEVVGELRRGYLIGERLLRPAMVKVARS